MRVIGESAFDIAYLIFVVIIGIAILRRAKGQKQYILFGLMAIVLGGGDAFHLVPRVIALNTVGVENAAAMLGTGKFITSITMTLFYVMLYYVWRLRYGVQGKNGLTAVVIGLAAARIALCLFPQNDWQGADAPLSWGIYRNIPFLILGIILIVLFYRYAKEKRDRPFRFMWLAITLSFALYVPVVLFADTFPAIGMLMIPKTLAYVWVVLMGYFDEKKGNLCKEIMRA